MDFSTREELLLKELERIKELLSIETQLRKSKEEYIKKLNETHLKQENIHKAMIELYESQISNLEKTIESLNIVIEEDENLLSIYKKNNKFYSEN